MKIKDVTSALECFAPLPLQEDYDNAGLQVGLTEAEVSGVLLCLDVTEATVREAKEKTNYNTFQVKCQKVFTEIDFYIDFDSYTCHFQ